MGFDIDAVIVVAFFAITFFLALRNGSGISTIEEYALGGRKFSTTALVSTIVATWISGSIFFTDLSKTYSDGLFYIIPALCMPFSLLITAFLLAPRMGEFLGQLSVAEVMGNLYGKEVRLITAICGIAGNIGGLAIQFKVFGTLFHCFFNIPEEYALFLASAVVIIYSSFGGIKSVTYTDIIQFFTFIFVIPVIGIIVWNQFVSLGMPIADTSQNYIFNFSEVLNFGNPRFWEVVFLAFYFALPAIGAVDFQRISMARSIEQIKISLTISTVLVIFISLFIIWIPFLIFNMDQSINPNELFAYLVNNYSYTGFKGLMIIGISAMAMSTADSRINAVSVIVGYDLCKLFNIQINSLLISRISSFVFGIFAIYLALSENDLLAIIMASASFYMPIVTVPLVFSILGFRSTKKVVLIGMCGGFLSVMLWDYLDTGIHKIIPSMIINLFCMLNSHYLFKQTGGWVGIKDTSYLDKMKLRKSKKRKEMIDYIKNFNIFDFCLFNSPKTDTVYSFFGVFCFTSTLVSIYSTHGDFNSDHSSLLLFLYQTLLVISSFFMLYVVWYPRILNRLIISIIWNIALVYVLCFCSTFFLLLSDFGKLQLVAFTLNITVLFSIARWRLSLIMISAGIICATELYKYYFNVNSVQSLFDYAIPNLIYILLLLSTTLVTIFKPKQEYFEETEEKIHILDKEITYLSHENEGLEEEYQHLAREKYYLASQNHNLERKKHDLEEQNHNLERKVTDLNQQVGHFHEKIADQEKEITRLGATAQKILNNVNHELRLPVGNVMNFSEMLNEGLGKFNETQLKTLSDEVYKNSTRLSSMILNMLDLATLDVQKVGLKKSKVNFSEIVVDRVRTCCKIYIDNKPIRFKLVITPEIMIYVDPNYMRQVVDNLVINAIKFSEGGVVEINLEHKENIVIFTIQDQGVGIPPEEIHDIFTPFKMGSNTESRAEGRGVGLALCKSVLRAHDGDITATSQPVGAIFRMILPE